MTQSIQGPELVLPAAVLAAMHRVAGERTDGASFLRAVGTALGAPVLEALSGGSGGDTAATPSDDFWVGLRDYLSSRGWGTISHERIHPGLGRVRAVGWVESEDEESSPLTAGLLAGLFTAVAGGEIDVLEAPRSEDERDLEFVYGSPEAVQALQRLLDDGADLTGALGQL